jgi:hypothetical protein
MGINQPIGGSTRKMRSFLCLSLFLVLALTKLFFDDVETVWVDGKNLELSVFFFRMHVIIGQKLKKENESKKV